MISLVVALSVVTEEVVIGRQETVYLLSPASKLLFRFSAANFGKLFGLVMTVSAAFSLIQYPLFVWQENVMDGDPFAVRLLIFSLHCSAKLCKSPAEISMTSFKFTICFGVL